jgi:hypothetical protein
MSKIRPGLYRHFKGNTYRVLGIARHSETLEELVLYFRVEEPGTYWVRPLEMFLEIFEKDGKRLPRFAFIEE